MLRIIESHLPTIEPITLTKAIQQLQDYDYKLIIAYRLESGSLAILKRTVDTSITAEFGFMYLTELLELRNRNTYKFIGDTPKSAINKALSAGRELLLFNDIYDFLQYSKGLYNEPTTN